MEFETAQRDALADGVRRALEESCPGSRTRLLGSLAAGTADRYSDIDLEWTVPAEEFARSVTGARTALARVREVTDVRSDPEWRGSDRQRLLFVRFAGVPLLWRLDLVVRAEEPAAVLPEDDGAWSPAASALANAAGAVKAVARGRPETARGLLDRGYARIGAAERATGEWRRDVVGLARAAVRSEPGQAALGAEVRRLAAALL